MELKLEPLESHLRASWNSPAWPGGRGQDTCQPPPGENGSSIPPILSTSILAESLHTSDRLDASSESKELPGHLEKEIKSLSDTAVPNSSPTATDPPRQDAAQYNGQPDDLGTFIAVGSLTKVSVSEDRALQQALDVLKGNRWIHVHTHCHGPNVRIYVDPRMAHRNNTQRSVSKLREALKIIMSMIDRSCGAWEGQSQAQSPETTMSTGEDDESLWYIFNTLEDPKPRVDLMKDDWSRKAMQYLLSDEDFSDLGLKTGLYPYQRRSAAMMVQREAQPARMLDPRVQAFQTPEGGEYYYDKEDGFITLQKDMYDEAVGGKLVISSMKVLALESFKWNITWATANFQ